MNEKNCPGELCKECGFRSSIFSGLNDEQLVALSQNRTFVCVTKGDYIVKQGSPIEGVAFLRKGLAKITRTNIHREQIIRIVSPREFVGLLSVFSSPTFQYNIIAIEDCEYCMVSKQQIMDLLSKNQAFAKILLEKISQISDAAITIRLDIALRQLRGRVAFILCFFANEIYQSQKFTLPISRRELADLIDMRVENVVRILSELRRDNILRIEGNAFEIIDPERLKWIKEHG